VTHGWKPLEDSIICRASAGTQDLTKTLSKVMLLDAEVADPIDETQHAASTLDELELAVSAKALINDLGMLAVNPADISLSVAPFILSGGNGIRDWDTFHQAASILGATEGASRVAVDDGFMPRHRQVGASGIWVSARVYIAVGISGAVQHLQGISQVDKVIAINTNTKCDMIKRADLSIIADSTDILNALVELVQAQEVSEGESHAA
jgi:electron transfer flavoprotein alpha subunit